MLNIMSLFQTTCNSKLFNVFLTLYFQEARLTTRTGKFVCKLPKTTYKDKNTFKFELSQDTYTYCVLDILNITKLVYNTYFNTIRQLKLILHSIRY